MEQGDRILRGRSPRARPRQSPEQPQHHCNGCGRGYEQEGEGEGCRRAKHGADVPLQVLLLKDAQGKVVLVFLWYALYEMV